MEARIFIKNSKGRRTGRFGFYGRSFRFGSIRKQIRRYNMDFAPILECFKLGFRRNTFNELSYGRSGISARCRRNKRVGSKRSVEDQEKLGKHFWMSLSMRMRGVLWSRWRYIWKTQNYRLEKEFLDGFLSELCRHQSWQLQTLGWMRNGVTVVRLVWAKYYPMWNQHEGMRSYDGLMGWCHLEATMDWRMVLKTIEWYRRLFSRMTLWTNADMNLYKAVDSRVVKPHWTIDHECSADGG